MSAALTSWPAVTGLALLVRVPAAGRVVIFTAARALAGVSLTSEDRKSVVEGKRVDPGGGRTVKKKTAGASLTLVTSKVMVMGDWFKSTPPLAVPPSSCTWKVKVA